MRDLFCAWGGQGEAVARMRAWRTGLGAEEELLGTQKAKAGHGRGTPEDSGLQGRPLLRGFWSITLQAGGRRMGSPPYLSRRP